MKKSSLAVLSLLLFLCSALGAFYLLRLSPSGVCNDAGPDKTMQACLDRTSRE